MGCRRSVPFRASMCCQLCQASGSGHLGPSASTVLGSSWDSGTDGPRHSWFSSAIFRAAGLCPPGYTRCWELGKPARFHRRSTLLAAQLVFCIPALLVAHVSVRGTLVTSCRCHLRIARLRRSRPSCARACLRRLAPELLHLVAGATL